MQIREDLGMNAAAAEKTAEKKADGAEGVME